jgi:hypothetical protein
LESPTMRCAFSSMAAISRQPDMISFGIISY